jgi:hypothetical protein
MTLPDGTILEGLFEMNVFKGGKSPMKFKKVSTD